MLVPLQGGEEFKVHFFDQCRVVRSSQFMLLPKDSVHLIVYVIAAEAGEDVKVHVVAPNGR
jgi:hypothetical protein